MKTKEIRELYEKGYITPGMSLPKVGDRYQCDESGEVYRVDKFCSEYILRSESEPTKWFWLDELESELTKIGP